MFGVGSRVMKRRKGKRREWGKANTGKEREGCGGATKTRYDDSLR